MSAKDQVENVAAWAVGTVGAGLIWVVRRVITNQKQIELLQTEIRGREELRQRDRDDIQEVKRDVKHLSATVLDLVKDQK